MVFRVFLLQKWEISWCSSDPVLRASLRTAAGPHPSSGRCSWKVCRVKSSRCNESWAHHQRLWNWHSVLRREAGRSYPRSAAPFIFVSVQKQHNACYCITLFRKRLLMFWPKMLLKILSEKGLTRTFGLLRVKKKGRNFLRENRKKFYIKSILKKWR